MKSKLIHILISIFIAVSLNAQHDTNEHGSKKHDDKDHHDDHHDDDHHDDHHHKNHLALFNGATTNFDHSSTDYTIGLDYEFRISNLLGLGFGAEYILTDAGELVLGIPVFIHPAKGLKFIVAPIGVNAVAHSEHNDDGTGDTHKAGSTDSTDKEWHFGARIGAAYDIHVGKLSLSPTIAYDITNTQALVYGLAIGIGF